MTAAASTSLRSRAKRGNFALASQGEPEGEDCPGEARRAKPDNLPSRATQAEQISFPRKARELRLGEPGEPGRTRRVKPDDSIDNDGRKPNSHLKDDPNG